MKELLIRETDTYRVVQNKIIIKLCNRFALDITERY